MSAAAPFVPPLPPGPRRVVVGALLVGTLLASMEVVVAGPAMPAVVQDLGAAGLYPWVFTAYVAAQTVTIPVYGWLADRWGRRDGYLLSVLLFVLGSAICGLADRMELVVAGRAVQGLGAGGLVPLTVTVFGDLYPLRERTRMQGIFSLVWGLSSLLGPLLGGLLTELWSWRAIFWINVAPGVVAGTIVVLALPRALGRHARAPDAPAGRLALLRDPTQQAVLGSGLVLGGVLLGVVGYVPLQVQAVGGGSVLDAGMALLPMSLAWTLAANLAGRLLGRLGFRGLTRAGTALVAAGCAALAWRADAAVGLVGLLLVGMGMGLVISTWNVAVQEAAPMHLRGTATSLSLFSRSVGGAVAVPALAAIAGIRPGTSSFAQVPDLPAGMGRLFLALAGAALVSAVIAWARFPAARSPD